MVAQRNIRKVHEIYRVSCVLLTTILIGFAFGILFHPTAPSQETISSWRQVADQVMPSVFSTLKEFDEIVVKEGTYPIEIAESTVENNVNSLPFREIVMKTENENLFSFNVELDRYVIIKFYYVPLDNHVTYYQLNMNEAWSNCIIITLGVMVVFYLGLNFYIFPKKYSYSTIDIRDW